MITARKTREIVDALVKLRGMATDEQACEVQVLYPEWKEGVEYAAGDRILHNNVLYKVLTTHTSQTDWTPDAAVSLFAKVLIPNENVIYPWEQPESTNPYKKGDKVTHNNKTWISLIDGNVWEPGVPSTWEEVIE